MRLVIDRIPAGGLKVHRHAAVVTDGEDIEQLLQVGPMVLAVPPGAQSETLHSDRHNQGQSTACSNGRCERVVQTLRRECLSKFIIFGKRHLDHLLVEFTEYYNTVRSSMVRDHLPPVRDKEPDEIETIKLEQVEVKGFRRAGEGVPAQGGIGTPLLRCRGQRQHHRCGTASKDMPSFYPQ